MKVQVETPHGDVLIGTVPDDTDLDGEFVLTADDDGERYTVQGWNCYVYRLAADGGPLDTEGADRCMDCGEWGERTGHQTCQYPGLSEIV